MSYEREPLIRARERYAQAVDEHKQARRRLREQVFAAYPQAARLDAEIRGTVAEVMAHAFRFGEDPGDAIAQIREENLYLQQEYRAVLASAGVQPEELDDGPLCRICGDTGYVGKQMCQCLETFYLEEQRKELTSLLSQNASFDDFDLSYYPETVNPATGLSPRMQMELIYETCVNYASHFNRKKTTNLLMSGGTGLGKTFLSACIAREVVARGYSVVYDTAIHVFACLEKQKFGSSTDEDDRVAQRVMACDLLILDDLGTEMNTSFISTALYSIVGGRLMAEKPTIISTNYTIDQLTKRYTPQIASRLLGEYNILSFAGNDIRRLKSGQ